jgi:hypothetical protein
MLGCLYGTVPLLIMKMQEEVLQVVAFPIVRFKMLLKVLQDRDYLDYWFQCLRPIWYQRF